MTPKPKRRLTQAVPKWCASCQKWTDHYDHQHRMVTRTGRRKSWWQRGWRRG